MLERYGFSIWISKSVPPVFSAIISAPLSVFPEYEKEAIRIYQEMEKLVHRNATEVMNQEEFWAVYLRKKDRYQDIQKQLEQPTDNLPVIQRARDKFEGIIKSDIQFDEQLWYSLLDHIVVCDDNKFDVILRSERVIHIVV